MIIQVQQSPSIQSGGSGGVIIKGATNGLSTNGKNIALGGLLNGNTTIDANSNALTIQNYDGGLYFIDNGGGGTYFNDTGRGGINFQSNGGSILIGNNGHNGGVGFLDRDEVFLAKYNDSGMGLGMQLMFDDNGAKFTDNRTGSTAVGIQYASNYGINFNARSIPDVGWVTGYTASHGGGVSFAQAMTLAYLS
ncbi:MAG: hypothetical protein QM734_03135 [Cyclobacteriaceae bacterium]